MRIRPGGAHVLRRPPGPRRVLLWDIWPPVALFPFQATILPTLSLAIMGAVRAPLGRWHSARCIGPEQDGEHRRDLGPPFLFGRGHAEHPSDFATATALAIGGLAMCATADTLGTNCANQAPWAEQSVLAILHPASQRTYHRA